MTERDFFCKGVDKKFTGAQDNWWHTARSGDKESCEYERILPGSSRPRLVEALRALPRPLGPTGPVRRVRARADVPWEYVQVNQCEPHRREGMPVHLHQLPPLGPVAQSPDAEVVLVKTWTPEYGR
jgi:hypothetical protein